MGRREPGYRPEPKIYRMVFADHPGLIVRARSASTAAFLAIADLADEDPTVDEMRGLFADFASVLVSWNLEDEDGDLVPTTLEGLMTLPMEMVQTFITGWMEAVAGVAVPLAQPSTDGRPSPVESLPMEPLSQSQAS